MGHPVPTRSIWKEWKLLSEFRRQEHGAEPKGGVQRSRAHSWLDSQVFMNMDNLSFCFNRFKINMDMTLQFKSMSGLVTFYSKCTIHLTV